MSGPLLLAGLLAAGPALAGADPAPLLWTEAGAVWQSRNDVQIPADGGTPFSLVELGAGPALAGRIYGQLGLWQRHELRGMWAPFTLRQAGRYDTAITFMGETYAADTALESLYRFNSYRLTYRFTVLDTDRASLKLGFTGKLRDAEIGLSQGQRSSSRKNLGFVPLLHLAYEQSFTDEVGLLVDIDALWSPYGRAEDVALMGTFEMKPWLRGLLGYRTVEGGSDGGGGVYSFAWLHYVTAGLQVGSW
jgi:hypothetical protein